MAGNVLEWASSIFETYPYRRDDWREDLNVAENRVLRGGSWLDLYWRARSACRVEGMPNACDGCRGFRLALASGSS
jgi:formylglycine-generating enzyme required for sulfatase activity